MNKYMSIRIFRKILCLVITVGIGILVGMIYSAERIQKRLKKLYKEQRRLASYNHLLLLYWKLVVDRKSFINYLRSNNYSRVAIFGVSEITDLLIQELKNGDVTISCLIESEKNRILYYSYPVLGIAELKKLEADVIICSTPHIYDYIREQCVMYSSVPVISIKDMFEEINYK